MTCLDCKMKSVRKKNKSIKLKVLDSRKTNLKTTSMNLNKRKPSMLSAKLKFNKLNGRAVIYREHISYSNNKKIDMKNNLV